MHDATPHMLTDGAPSGLLRYQRCADCGCAQTHQCPACAPCGSAHLIWQEAEGCGTVVAASVVSRLPAEASGPCAPRTLVLVELDEGPRVRGHAMPGTAIGDRVRAEAFAHDRRALLRFARTASQVRLEGAPA